MIDQYKAFFLSKEMLEITPYAAAIVEDDVESFARAFEPYVNESLMIDPIEIAAAYNSNDVFTYLITTYDYSDYHNPFNLTLPIVLVIFEREHMLVDALEKIPFEGNAILMMYEFMLEMKEASYFKEFYNVYKIPEDYRIALLKATMHYEDLFKYMVETKDYDECLEESVIVHDIVAYHQHLLPYIAFIDDITDYVDLEAMVPILEIEDETLFKDTIDFMLNRKLDLNAHNAFGLTFFHEALRHGAHASYLYHLLECGANPFFKTTRGYPASHQLLFRDVEFTLDLSRLVDFDAKDLFGLTLKDYDTLQRKTTLQLLDVLLVVKLMLNMDESAIYELEYGEFFDLADVHGIDVFINAYTVIAFENETIKTRFCEHFERRFNIEDVTPLEQSLKDAFIYDADTTVELLDDILALDDDTLATLAEYAKTHETALKIATDGPEINKAAKIEFTIANDGTITKHATVTSHYIDVYYIHTYYGVPLKNITYTPKLSKKERFLN